MSALESNQVWSPLVTKESSSSKYEKCRNITEEIYKRINITFEIKKLETEGQSDVSQGSDLIDSNELSNETDLFACDKSTSIPSSEPELAASSEKYININNNEELKKKLVVYKRPKKRFRKRVKKRQCKPAAASESDGSSDEALPLSRVAERDAAPDRAGGPNILILTKDVKPKILCDKEDSCNQGLESAEPAERLIVKCPGSEVEDKTASETRSCTKCSLTFRGERGLKRHMSIAHVIDAGDKPSRAEREAKPA